MRAGLLLDARLFAFEGGTQIHIPMVDEFDVDLVVIGLDGKRRRVFPSTEDADTSNLKTGIMVKPPDDSLTSLDVPTDPTGFTFD